MTIRHLIVTSCIIMLSVDRYTPLSSLLSSCGLSGAGRCRSTYKHAPGFTILRSMIGGSRPLLSGVRSDSTVRSQVWVWRGQPERRFHSLGKGATHAVRARLWSIHGSARAMWPKNLRRVVRVTCVSGGWSLRRRTSSLEMRALQEMSNNTPQTHPDSSGVGGYRGRGSAP